MDCVPRWTRWRMQNRETQAAVTLGDRTSNRGPISHPRGGLEPPTKTIIRRQLSALSTAARLAESPEWSETAGQRAGRPSIWCCRDHSAAKSMSRALVHDCLGNNRLVRSSKSSRPHHTVLHKQRFPGSVQIALNWRGFVYAFCLRNLSIGFQGPFRGRPCGRNLGSQCGVINLGGPIPRSPSNACKLIIEQGLELRERRGRPL